MLDGLLPDLAQNIVLLIFGIVVIYYGADWLVRGSSRLAAAWGVPPIVVGLTVVSLGTFTDFATQKNSSISDMKASLGTNDTCFWGKLSSSFSFKCQFCDASRSSCCWGVVN